MNLRKYIIRKAPAFYNRGYGEEYSVAKAILGMDDVSQRGFEWEVSQDLERQQPKSNPNAVIIDMTRTMTSGTAGANTIQTNVSKFYCRLYATEISCFKSRCF